VKSGSSGPARGSYTERLGLFFLALAVGLSLAGAVVNFGRLAVPAVPLSEARLEFSAERALAFTTAFATSFPERADGHPDRAAAARWLLDQFVALGYSPQVQTYGAWIRGVWYGNLANVWAVRPGRSLEAVAVFAHYDIPPFVSQGAADNASALLELARVFAAVDPERSIIFICTGTEEYGMAGARAFLARKPYLGPVVAAVGLDHLNPGPMEGIIVECAGTHQGYTPPWLRNLAFRSAGRVAPVAAPSPLEEWVERSVAVPAKDSGMFLRSGVPAVNLRGLPADADWARAIHHTPRDTVDNLEAASFAKWGRAAELLVRTAAEAAIPPGPAASMTYLGLSADGSAAEYLSPWALRAVQLLLLAPLWMVVGVGWHRRRRMLRPVLGIVLAEARRVMTLAGCLVVGLGALKLMRAADLLARYEIYPATSKDPYLYHPAPVPLLLALAVVAGAFYLTLRYTGWLRPPLAADWLERHHALATILAAVAFVVWLDGAGCAAVAFFVLPACLWLILPEPAPGVGRERPGSLAHGAAGAMVVLSTAVVAALIGVAYGPSEVGPLWWYLPLAAAHGLISLKSSLVFAVAAGLHWEAFLFATGLGAGRVIPPTRYPVGFAELGLMR